MSKLAVANAILQHLGGQKFIAMTGASDFLGGTDFLSFRLPGSRGFCKQGINHVRITLTPMDVYTVQFNRIVGHNALPIQTKPGVSFAGLRAVFAEVTGLRTQLT